MIMRRTCTCIHVVLLMACVVSSSATNMCGRDCNIGNGPRTCDEIVAAAKVDAKHACVLLKYAGCQCDGWVCGKRISL